LRQQYRLLPQGGDCGAGPSSLGKEKKKALGVCSHRLTSDWALTIRMQVDNDISDDNVGS